MALLGKLDLGQSELWRFAEKLFVWVAGMSAFQGQPFKNLTRLPSIAKAYRPSVYCLALVAP
jgi:hypothetical protein